MMAGSGNTAPALTSITVFFFCWAVFTFALRLYVKLPKRDLWGIDDSVIAFALVRFMTTAVGARPDNTTIAGGACESHCNDLCCKSWLWCSVVSHRGCRKCREGIHEHIVSQYACRLTQVLQALYAAQLLYVISMGGEHGLVGRSRFLLTLEQ